MKSEYKKILIVCLIMGIALLVHDYMDARINFDGSLQRNEPGEGEVKEQLDLSFNEETREMTVEVSEKGLSKEESDDLFEQAIAEIDETYLGENESPDHVSHDLNLGQSYCNGLITAYWKFDEYGIISNEGKINQEAVTEEGKLVNLTAQLSYEDETEIYNFVVVVYPLSLDTIEGQMSAIEKELAKVDSETRTSEKLKLPNEIEGIRLTWKRKMNFRGLQLILLGVVAILGLKIGEKRDEAEKKKKLIDEKERDYPLIVSELSILLGAGMSFRKALERIIANYQKKKKQGITRAGYEEMVYTYRKMIDGMGELKALEDMGQKSDSKEYRKLAMLLTQNLKKGSKDLIESLEKEEKYAFEMRKQRAIRAGEEASTKLLIPMAGMLFIVIVILIVPAVMQIKL